MFISDLLINWGVLPPNLQVDWEHPGNCYSDGITLLRLRNHIAEATCFRTCCETLLKFSGSQLRQVLPETKVQSKSTGRFDSRGGTA